MHQQGTDGGGESVKLKPYQLSFWVVKAIALYRKYISPLLRDNCRYRPTCSDYAQQALTTHGLRRGGWMAMRRIGRCHPWRDGGYDPVPPRRTSEGTSPAQGNPT
jgi:putative membrane protein insertion efficiency factor